MQETCSEATPQPLSQKAITSSYNHVFLYRTSHNRFLSLLAMSLPWLLGRMMPLGEISLKVANRLPHLSSHPLTPFLEDIIRHKVSNLSPWLGNALIKGDWILCTNQGAVWFASKFTPLELGRVWHGVYFQGDIRISTWKPKPTVLVVFTSFDYQNEVFMYIYAIADFLLTSPQSTARAFDMNNTSPYITLTHTCPLR